MRVYLYTKKGVLFLLSVSPYRGSVLQDILRQRAQALFGVLFIFSVVLSNSKARFRKRYLSYYRLFHHISTLFLNDINVKYLDMKGALKFNVSIIRRC